MNQTSPTAAVIVIGNEILSGRTHESNMGWLAGQLTQLGIPLKEGRVVRDEDAAIIEAVDACRKRYTYVFTTGGIGPTHDDITSACIARAFGVPLFRHPEAVSAMEAHYEKGQLNEARLKMADVPQGAALIPNPVSAAPGYRIENVYVLAGVPRIMQAMFDNIKGELRGGAPVLSRTLRCWLPEGTVAEALAAVQSAHDQVEIGSYPFVKENRLGTSLVVRGTVRASVDAAFDATVAMVGTLGGECEEEA